MSVSESSTKLEDIKPVRSSTPRVASSSSSSLKKAASQDKDEDPSVISHVHGEGDFTIGTTADAPAMDPVPVPANSEDKTDGAPAGRQPQPNSSLQRIRKSFSKTQAQLVELFSRGNPSRSNSFRKLGKKRSNLDTFVASSSSTSSNSEPRLLAATRKSSTPLITNSSSSRRLQYRQFSKNLEEIAERDEPPPMKPNTSQHSIKPSSSSLRQQLPKNCGANFIPRDSKDGGNPKPEQQLQPNELHKLQEENRQLWEDNRILASTLEDLQPKMEYLQGRNKYLEIAIYQEGKVLTDIIKQCHEEIARLKATQCELMSGSGGGGESFMRNLQQDKDADFEKKIREYYITKYSTYDGGFGGNYGVEGKEFQ